MASPKSSKSPAFQYYPKDFLTDSNVLAMSLTEIGAYWKLISICWIDDSLPTSAAALARLVGIPQKHFARLWPALAPCFKEKNGRLIHPRLERERAAQALFRAKQAENGKRGGRPRLNPEKPTANSGGTQTQPRKSSSISDLQSSSATASTTSEERRRLPSPSGAPIVQKRKAWAAWEGPRSLDVPTGQHARFRDRLNRPDADAVLFAWYAEVADEWSTGARKDDNIGSSVTAFWDARFDEKWPPADTPRSKHADVPRSQRWRPA